MRISNREICLGIAAAGFALLIDEAIRRKREQYGTAMLEAGYRGGRGDARAEQEWNRGTDTGSQGQNETQAGDKAGSTTCADTEGDSSAGEQPGAENPAGPDRPAGGDDVRAGSAADPGR